MLRRAYLFATAACALAVSAATADTLLTEQILTPGMTIQISGNEQGKAESKKEVRIWLGEGRARFDQLNRSVILRKDEGKVYVIDRSRRSYVEAPWPSKLIDLVDPAIAATLGSVEAALGAETTLTPTEEWAEKGKWRGRRFDASIDSPVMHVGKTLWISNELAVDRALFAELMRAAALADPLGGRLLELIADTGGVPIAEEASTEVGGYSVKSSRQLVSIQEVAPPEGHYAPPQDFRKVEHFYRSRRELGLK